MFLDSVGSYLHENQLATFLGIGALYWLYLDAIAIVVLFIKKDSDPRGYNLDVTVVQFFGVLAGVLSSVVLLEVNRTTGQIGLLSLGPAVIAIGLAIAAQWLRQPEPPNPN